MRSELEPQDIENIATAVVAQIKPLLAESGENRADDCIFDVKGLAKYLQVKAGWVYDRVRLKEIPHYKLGKYPRFRKSVIDAWLAQREVINGEKRKNTVRRLLEVAK